MFKLNKKFLLLTVLGIFAVIALIGCNNNDEPANPAEPTEPQELTTAATEALTAISNQNFGNLSDMAHPDLGVTFSPYGYINQNEHRTFTTQQLQALEPTQEFNWGNYDGSGDPIELTVDEYWNRFVYDQDYLNAPQIAQNEILGTGNTLINIDEVFPDSNFVEYHFPGFDPQYDGMDWRSLRLIFVEESNEWKLVGVVHDEWTI